MRAVEADIWRMGSRRPGRKNAVVLKVHQKNKSTNVIEHIRCDPL
jgi:hypothetical protein